MRPDYGLDAPGVVRNLALGGVAAALAAFVFQAVPIPQADRDIGSSWFAVTALICMTEAGWMLYSSRRGKLRMREKVIDALALRGNEGVLDVGCGRGLLLVAAAKRLPQGGAVGIDLWSARDQSGNKPEATLQNARLEGVEERVTVVTGDMREMPFPDASFDAAVASLSIHNIPSRDGRAQAVKEIARVLKPGGRVGIMDIAGTRQYLETLRELGWTDVRRTGFRLQMFPPLRIVIGTKPPKSGQAPTLKSTTSPSLTR